VPPSYARLFGEPPRSERREDGFGRFLSAIMMNDSAYLLDPRHRAATGGSTLSGVDGGFAVPAPVSAKLLSLVVEQSQFLSLCRVVPMEGKTTSYPVLNIRDRTKGPGKLQAKRQGEGATGTYQAPKMEDVTLTANKKVVLWSCTTEQLQDSVPGTDAALLESAAGTFAMEIDREILSGTGVAEGLGVLNSTCLVVHSKDGGQTASTVSFTNLSGMIARLAPRSFNNAVWVINQTALPALFGVYLATGASGGIPAPMTQLPDGSYRLFGRPLIVSDFAPALSAQGDLMLLDLSWLVVGMREDLRFEISRDALFANDEVAFKMVRRSDIKGVINGTITPANGANALSPFVALEAR
jgi:HK97 family phage major capsid protein